MESTKRKIRNKIGARCLTAKEVSLILPTYGQVTKQIEQFRQEKTEHCQAGDQRTNNIGIICCSFLLMILILVPIAAQT